METPKLFISYRWSSPEHSEWVLGLATNLRGDGIDVKLDRWDLRPGHDALKFMEEMVTDESISKVLIISDRGYAERANEREGGVGVEAQIISRRVYESTKQEKFAAILLELDQDGRPVLPTFLESRIFFDFTTDEARAQNYEQIVRWVYGKPLDVRPPIGQSPKYLENDSRSLIPIHRVMTRGAIEASSTAKVTAQQILDTVAGDAKSFILNLAGESDQSEIVYQAILQTSEIREQTYAAFRTLLRSGDVRAFERVHSFFEVLIKWWDYAPVGATFSRWDNDVLHYFTHDAFVGFIALALAENAYEPLSEFLATPFYKAEGRGLTGSTVSYDEIKSYLESLEMRNREKKLNRLSLHADIISETHENSIVSLENFCEADLLLHLRGILSTKYEWYPVSALWLTRNFGAVRLFAKAESAKFYQRISPLLFGKSPTELRADLTPYTSGQVRGLQFDYRPLSLGTLLNLERLGTNP